MDAGAGECPHAPLFAHTHYVRLDRGIGDKAWDYSKIEVLGDISDLPFHDGSFDAVINIQVLEHLKEPGIGISEMARVLKPGGQLILTTVQCWEIHQHPNDFFRYTRYGLTYLFDKAGLESRVEALGGLFWLIGFRLMADPELLSKELALADFRGSASRFRLCDSGALLLPRSCGSPPRLHARLFLLVSQTITVTSSLIIITLNRAALLQRTLQGLTRQTRQIDEIIVIDNGPTRDTEQVVSAFAARYVPEPRRGYGHARNRGLDEASGALIYFLDDDCVPEPDWANVLWNVLDSGSADLASGSRIPGQAGLAARLEYLSTDGPVLSPALAAGAARHLSTSNLILRREVVAKTGCFDATLTMCEDRDFTTRARKLGFRLRYEPKARVTHYPAIHQVSEYLAKMRHYGTGTSQYFRRSGSDENR